MRRFISASIAAALIGLPLTLRADRARQAPDGFPAAGAPPVVTVLSTGAEPRMALAYKVAAGTSAKADMTTAISMKISMPGMGMEMPEMPMPVMKMAVDVAVDAVAPNGDMTVRMNAKPSMDLSSVPAEMASAMGGLDVANAAFSATGVMTSRGALRDMKMTGSAMDNPQFRQAIEQAQTSMNQAVAALPDVPVGVGAKWEVRQRSPMQGFESYSTTTSEIVAITGRKVTLKVTSTMTAPPQAMQNPMLPPGAEISLAKMTGTGSGTSTVDLDQVISEGAMDMIMNMDVNMNMQGMSQAMSMVMTMKLAFKPVK